MSSTAQPSKLTADELCRRGYFPRELPPSFTTESFSQATRNRSVGPARTQCVRHNLTRINRARRPLKVPNPVAFTELADVTTELWPEIRELLHKIKFSISQPVITTSRGRTIRPRFRYGESSRYRAWARANRRYVLRTDVNQFYASIYTHSIPWALHGKARAKQAHRNRKSLAGDRLDRAFRNAADGQTIGIPIGPDPSFLAAELILTAIDVQLAAKHPDLHGFRYLDDYEFACSSKTEAEVLRVALESALADFELAMNPTKTSIQPLPIPVGESWPDEIHDFEIRDDVPQHTTNDLLALFSMATGLAQDHPGALKYALSSCREVTIPRSFWSTFQHLVWSAVSSELTALPAAVAVLSQRSHELELPVDQDLTSNMLEKIILTHGPVSNSSEVLWALWTAIHFDARLSAESAKIVSATEDDFIALMALQAADAGVFDGDLDLDLWTRTVEVPEAVYGPHWLLAYESAVHDWLPDAENHATGQKFFKDLLDQDVAFFDISIQPDWAVGPAGPLPGALVPDDYF